MTELPHITVIIPTRERGDVLEAALATVTAQDYPQLTILVSDNCSTDQTRKVVEANRDPRIRYVNTGSRVSMSHNWEFALSHVQRGWVMVIGDDDGLLPGALRRIAALIAGHPGIRAINGNYATYVWPNPMNQQYGRLLVPMRRGTEVRKTGDWLPRVISGEGWYTDLPMLYASGVVEFALLDEIRQHTGRFFQSCQPDIYSTLAFCSVLDRYLWSHEPLAIAGHSKHSNGASWTASTGKKEAYGQSDPNKIFMSEGIIPFHPDVTPLDDGNVPLNIDLLVYESWLQSRHLRSDDVQPDPARQLAQFMARDAADPARMDQWVGRFAQRHQIDLAAIGPKVVRERRRLRRASLRDQVAKLVGTFRVEPSFGLRMRDVFEASVVAGTVLSTRPSLARSYLSTARKRLGARSR